MKKSKRDIYYKYKVKEEIYGEVCGRYPKKAMYRTRARAQSVIDLAGKGKDLFIYNCSYCGNYHLKW